MCIHDQTTGELDRAFSPETASVSVHWVAHGEIFFVTELNPLKF